MSIIETTKIIKVNPTSLECDDILYKLKDYCNKNSYSLLDNLEIYNDIMFVDFIKSHFEKKKKLKIYIEEDDNNI